MPNLINKLTLCLTVAVLAGMGGTNNLSAREATPVLDSAGISVGTPSELSPKSSVKGQPATAVYIVQLTDPPIASYLGGIPGYTGTSRSVTGERNLNTKSSAAKKYGKYLQDRQADIISKGNQKIGRNATVTYNYQHAFNGFALLLTGKEARAFAGLQGVLSVNRETLETMDTDAGPIWIDAPTIWNGGHPGSKGEGAVIAVLDSGINHDHPSFAGIGGDGYRHTNPLGSGNYLPGSYCDTVDSSFCNDKLIGAWDMVQSGEDPDSPEDAFEPGHGSHTASTAAGNVVKNAKIKAPTATLSRNVSGVAPHANVIMYDVCIDTCPQSALLAAVDQVVIDAGELPDGIASLNYSISGGENPYGDPMEYGFLAAADAGIFVSASAGNSGPGATTVAHRSPWLAATAASTHNRAVVNSVIQLTSDGAPLGDIVGLGFTGAYSSHPIVNSADYETDYPGATLCGVGAQDDYNSPWPPGFFNGEIVACTRGTFGRIEKGANVLAAGAGGYVLMDNGGGLVGDAHDLPAVHISAADGAKLANWLAANSNTMAAISGFVVDMDPGNGDVVAGFSSRGPNTTIDVLKPDVAAPGVDIIAAINTDGVTYSPEFGFLSGTSMASPHNAGAGALMSRLHPDWGPHQIRSALMMTATTDLVKENGVTPADPHDIGAGRIDLHRSGDAGLVMDESTSNFLAADPFLRGDPRTLNIASMMDSECVGICTWTRTFKNVSSDAVRWKISVTNPPGVYLKLYPTNNVKIPQGTSRTVTITADATFADIGWHYGEVQLTPKTGHGAPLHLPVAIYVTAATNPGLFTKTVDSSTAHSGDTLNYEMRITNSTLEREISLADKQPAGATFVAGSATAVVTNGTTTKPVAIRDNVLSWSGNLDKGGIAVVSDTWPPGGTPFGYLDLPGDYGVLPLPCSSTCDDSTINLTGLPPFRYDGQVYTSIRMSSNGLIVPGGLITDAATPVNQDLPDPALPNPIAPFWADLDLDGTNAGDTGSGHRYAAVFNSGAFTVLEWNNVEEWGVPGPKYTFQIQIGNIGSGYEGIWFTYHRLDGVPSFLTVGAENDTGTAGDNYYFDGTGTFPIEGGAGELMVKELIGGTATIKVKAKATCDVEAVVNEAKLTSGWMRERAIAVTHCN